MLQHTGCLQTQLCWLQVLRRWWRLSKEDLTEAITAEVGNIEPADLQTLKAVLRVSR